jgi:hypothetical protein
MAHQPAVQYLCPHTLGFALRRLRVPAGARRFHLRVHPLTAQAARRERREAQRQVRNHGQVPDDVRRPLALLWRPGVAGTLASLAAHAVTAAASRWATAALMAFETASSFGIVTVWVPPAALTSAAPLRTPTQLGPPKMYRGPNHTDRSLFNTMEFEHTSGADAAESFTANSGCTTTSETEWAFCVAPEIDIEYPERHQYREHFPT